MRPRLTLGQPEQNMVGGLKMIKVKTKHDGRLENDNSQNKTKRNKTWLTVEKIWTRHLPSASGWGAILTEVLPHTFSPFLDMQPFLRIFNLGGWSLSSFEGYFPTRWFDTLVAGNSLLGHNGRGLGPLDGWVGGGFSWQLRDF